MLKCSNASCDLHWLDPAPLPELLPSFYKQYHTHTVEPVGGSAKRLYTQSVNAYLSAKFGYCSVLTVPARIGRWIIQLIPTLRDDAAARVFWLPAIKQGKLLEVGFGNGATLARLSEFGWDVAGVEFDAVSVNLARSLGLNVDLGSIEDAAYPAETFDAVVASHLIEHLPDPARFLRESRRVLAAAHCQCPARRSRARRCRRAPAHHRGPREPARRPPRQSRDSRCPTARSS